ncbi:MAG: hypothetical protein D6719_01700 [Candidatus Dadabacteria bacterium]|nr:MAG: hypothetical protein D6719_01700 [Candidatus Dadabacteria bacterium]
MMQNRDVVQIKIGAIEGEAVWIPEDQLYYGHITNMIPDPDHNRVDEISFQGVDRDALKHDLEQQIVFYEETCRRTNKKSLIPKP